MYNIGKPVKGSGKEKSAGEHNERVLGRTSIMAVVKELIRTEENGTISFGDYEKTRNQRFQTIPIREICIK